MISVSPTAQDSRARLTVDETRIQDRSWHIVDLGALRADLEHGTALRRPVRAALGASSAWDSFGQAGSRAEAVAPMQVPRRLKRVPDAAFVTIGRTQSRPTLPTIANDNWARPSSKRIRFALRDAVMMVILAVTLAGAFYSGRLHAAQTVIVVPPPASERNVLT